MAFRKGESGNPKGREKGSVSLTTYLQREFYANKEGIKDVFITVLEEARKGERWAAQLIFKHVIDKQNELNEDEFADRIVDRLVEVPAETLAEVFEKLKSRS